MVASVELSLNIAKYIKDKYRDAESVTSNTIKTDKTIPTNWEQVFHPGVGHSHQLSEFKKNVNTSDLSFDNLSVIEVFQKDTNFSSQFKVLILGGSTTDPLGTQFSGFRGTWVHHLFDSISQNNSSRYIIDNAANGASTSSNELLRLITKFHSNKYDLVISYNGINEIYFLRNPYLRNKENVLASDMLLEGMNDMNVIKAMGGKIFVTELPFPSNLLREFRKYWKWMNIKISKSRTNLHLMNIKSKFVSKKIEKNANSLNKEIVIHDLSEEEKEMLTYGADIWEKNIEFMYSASAAMNSKYLAILQPTLGLNNDYCKPINKNCLLSNRPEYIARMRYLYSILRLRCSKKNYCYDISSDYDLTNDDSLYNDGRHPNSEGNKRVADQIQKRIIKILNM